MWTEILTAVCLVMILEGIYPFLSPNGYKSMMRQLLDVDDKHFRTFGLTIMLIGLGLLILIR